MPTQKSWDILKELHSHPRDKEIVFDAELHKYTILGESKGWKSVSTVISMFCSHFDSKKAIHNLKNGRRWKQGNHPLCGKTDEEITKFWESENKSGTGIHARMEMYMNSIGKKLFESTSTPTPTEIIVDEFIYEDTILWVDPSTQEVYHPESNPDRVIGFLWKDEKVYRIPEEFSELGTAEVPLSIEIAIQESKQIESFFQDNTHLEPYRSEWMIWDSDFKLAGTMDAVFKNTRTGNLCIYDWKRVSSSLEPDISVVKWGYEVAEDEWLQPVSSSIQSMKEPLQDIKDTKYWHYALQLNLYRYILEKNYGVIIEEMCLVQIHPSFENYRIHRIPRMNEAIERILEYRRLHPDEESTTY
jgi:CRISPR/Cas system-associated exonuclease Cas4 (RecB family)